VAVLAEDAVCLVDGKNVRVFPCELEVFQVELISSEGVPRDLGF